MTKHSSQHMTSIIMAVQSQVMQPQIVNSMVNISPSSGEIRVAHLVTGEIVILVRDFQMK